MAVEGLSKNPDWSGGLYRIPINIGLVFGEVDVIATKRTSFPKTGDNYFPRQFWPLMCAVSFALFGPAVKNEAKV